MKEHGINFDLHALASPKSRQDCTLLAQEILSELANIRAHFESAAARCELHPAKEQKDTATEALQYIYGNIDLSTWRKVIDEKLTPPWPLPHHAEAMGLSAQQPAAVDEETAWREGWALAYSGADKLYGDDGELQDASDHPFIDWRRDSATEIRRKIQERGMRSLAAHQGDRDDD